MFFQILSAGMYFFIKYKSYIYDFCASFSQQFNLSQVYPRWNSWEFSLPDCWTQWGIIQYTVRFRMFYLGLITSLFTNSFIFLLNSIFYFSFRFGQGPFCHRGFPSTATYAVVDSSCSGSISLLQGSVSTSWAPNIYVLQNLK